MSITHDVFLRHSSPDKPIVRALAERLRADGIHVWFDEWEIKAGDSISAKIEAGTFHHFAFYLLPFLGGSLPQYRYLNWRPTIS